MAAKKKTPPEFPTDWHYEDHLEALARELAGRENRLAELEAMPGAEENVIEETRGEIAAVKAEIKKYTQSPKTASKRPKAKAETRG